MFLETWIMGVFLFVPASKIFKPFMSALRDYSTPLQNYQEVHPLFFEEAARIIPKTAKKHAVRDSHAKLHRTSTAFKFSGTFPHLFRPFPAPFPALSPAQESHEGNLSLNKSTSSAAMARVRTQHGASDARANIKASSSM